MPEITEESVLGSLESAFGNSPEPAAKPAESVPAQVASDDERTDLEKLADGQVAEQNVVEQYVVPEPEFVIEVNGKTEVVRGGDHIKELLQKGTDYSRKSEEVARAREQILAQAQMQQLAATFQQEVLGDIAELRAIDQQMEQFNKIDWSAAIDTDFTQAMKLQQHRQVLKEQRDAKIAALQEKKSQYERGQAQAAQQLRASEEAALLAKLPDWRNSEKAAAEQQAIARSMASYGYQPAEIANVMDHRLVLMGRDAMRWRELQRTKSEQVKRVADAPPVIKPGASSTQTDPNSKAGFDKFTREFRKQGRAGNHRAQEAALEKVFSRTFK